MKTFKRPQFAAILAAHAAGQVVTWKHSGYVLKGPPDDLCVVFTANSHACGLFHRDEETSDYDPADFTISPPVQTPAPDTLRQIVIDRLMTDLAANRSEWESEDLPTDADGFLDYSRVTRAFLETRTDAQLYYMNEANACLRYR